MSTNGKDPSRREYTRDEQTESYIQRRARAFTERSRDPGDATTWAVVLGALMCTLLMICFSVAGHARLAIVAAVVTAAWIFVVSRYGKVNVFSILWGAAATDASTPPNHQAVYTATVALSAVAAIAVIVDAITGWDFRWYGLLLGANILACLGIVFRAGAISTR